MEVAADADYYRTRRERVRLADCDYDGRGCKRRRAESHPSLARFVSTGHVLPSENAAAHAEGWEPLKNPSFGLEVMSPLKNLLEGDKQPYEDLSNPYAQLVNEVILPALSTSGTNSWDATDPEQPMLCFLELWERLLPPFMLQSVLDHVVMPKLSDAVDSWNPCEDNKCNPIRVLLRGVNGSAPPWCEWLCFRA
ncbi:hypothetical protein ACQ4PT_005134 [Festuca glaucescens]